MTNQYILVNVAEGRSQLNGGSYWRLTFVGLDDNITYEMTVDSAYSNFKRAGWNQVVTDDYPFGVYEGLKKTQRFTNRDVPILSADGRARIIYRCENDDELARLVEANARSFDQPSKFQELFNGN